MNLSIRRLDLRLKEKFKISHSEFDSIAQLLVIIADKEITAYGEIIPVEFFGEPFDKAHEQAVKVLSVYGKEISGIQTVSDVRQLVQKLSGQKYFNCIKCGFEMAMLDYLGKANKKMLWELLELKEPQKRKTPFTMPIMEGRSWKSRIPEDASLIKIKLGGLTDKDYLEYVKQDKSRDFFLDVNQGWTIDRLEEYQEYLNMDNVLMLEEPVKPDKKSGLAPVKKFLAKTPLFLDESVKSGSSAVGFAGYIDGVNIKITKFGGLLQSLEDAGMLKDKNLKLMLGCFLESSLSIAYAYSVSGLFDFIDLDGATFLKEEPFKGIKIHNGEIVMDCRGYGIGVEYE
ncbi:muconate cycloisomerase [Ruminiclostridium sufflavum DSM 19573]|uniref:Muconate cycloisomerase n=1 Tax=Ruminiclostridium sufflavum DSM 19573 TaxID=1121337 RepID=A0A318XPJ1_9FIRM|nr:enolase C-terminal domain-like protein [Ruminiclostridium sufflavum]PYG90231.1 muconate cycloisomerase [Ruminiclostridium sufflavum DSM 19573]